MANNSLDDLAERLNVATNDVAAYVAALRETIKTGMTAAEVETAREKLTAVEARLLGLAADPQDPVPDPEPLPE